MGRIPTADALLRRGISVHSPNCRLCGVEEESADHLFVNCRVAMEVWEWLWSWCRVPSRTFANIEEILVLVNNWGGGGKKRKVLIACCYGVLWRLWLARNERVFQNRISSASRIMDDIISLVFMWFKHRGKLVNCNWNVWCVSPFDCL